MPGGQVVIEGKEIEIGADRPAVQQQDGRCRLISGAGIPYEDLAPAGKGDDATGWERRWDGRARGSDPHGAGHSAQAAGLVAQRRVGGHGGRSHGGAGRRTSGGENFDGAADGQAIRRPSSDDEGEPREHGAERTESGDQNDDQKSEYGHSPVAIGQFHGVGPPEFRPQDLCPGGQIGVISVRTVGDLSPQARRSPWRAHAAGILRYRCLSSAQPVADRALMGPQPQPVARRHRPDPGRAVSRYGSAVERTVLTVPAPVTLGHSFSLSGPSAAAPACPPSARSGIPSAPP